MSGIEVHTRLEPLAREWDELAERATAAPWLYPGWVAAWLRAFGNGRPHVLALRRAGRLAAVAPFQSRLGGLYSPTNWHTPAYAFLAEDDTAREELVRGLYARRPRSVSISFVDAEGSGLCESRDAAGSAGYRLLRRTLERSPYVAVDGDWDAFEHTLGGKRLRELARRRRKLEQVGEVTFAIEDGSTRLDELLDEGFAVEASGWKGERGTAIACDSRTRVFYTDVAHWAAARGWLRLCFLRVGARAIAFEYNIEAEGVWYDLKDGHRPEYRAFAPGSLITHLVLREVFARGVRSYEFLGNDDPYKLEWTATVRERFALKTFAPSAAGTVEWSAFAFGRPIAKRALALVR